VVAPETDQSGVSHSLSLNDPLRLRQIGEKRFAVKGTPSDCIIMGVAHILKDHKPDLVLSGVNRGQNVAEDVTYSGTIAGAMEGTILGIRSIALSQAYGAGGRANLKWACAATHGPRVIEKILEIGIEPGILVNVNFPDCEPEDVQGVAVSAQGQRNQALLQIDARHDGRGNPYFWLAFAKARFEPGNGTDLKAIAENRISVTPLRLDLTAEPELTRFAAAFRA
jgi:5'-nucleotidase